MKVIPPLTITDAMLVSSTAAEPGPLEAAWSATAVYAEGNTRIIGTLTATVTISNASPAVVTWAANNIAVDKAVVFTTTGALPAGLTAGQVYYVKERVSADTFTVAATKGGPAINTTSAGSGTQTGTANIHRKYEALIGETGTVTMTIATPAVVTWTAHGRAAGDAIVFTTTGALPTGVTAGTIYYVIATGLTADAFQFSATSGGAAINTSGSQSSVHTCGLASTYNKPPMTSSDVWADAGPTNKLAMFDVLRDTATEVASPLTAVVSPGTRVDSIGLLALVGESVSVSITSVLGGGTVYTHTEDLSTREVGNWYEYFFQAFTYRTALALFDLPPYTDAQITASVTSTTGAVQCGAMVLGMCEDIGDIKYQAESDVLNFSTVTREFGEAEMVQQRNIPKTIQSIWAPKTSVNRIRNLREALNAEPAVWAGVEDDSDGWFESFLILGFYRRFSIRASMPNHAEISLELEEI